jgi:hypothetical protein
MKLSQGTAHFLGGFLFYFLFFLLGIFLVYIFNAIPKVPHTLPPIPYPTTPPFWPWRSPVLGHIRFASPMGLSLQWWPTRPSFDTYAAKDKSSRVLVSSYCCSTYRVAVPFSCFSSFFLNCVWVFCLHTCLCSTCVPDVHEGRRGHWILWVSGDWHYRWLQALWC